MSDPSDKIISLPIPNPEPLEIELTEENAVKLKRDSFRFGMSEQKLFEAYARNFVDYYEEHGHVPFFAVPNPIPKNPKPKMRRRRGRVRIRLLRKRKKKTP